MHEYFRFISINWIPAYKHWNEFMEIVNDSLHRIIRFLYDLSKCISKNNYALIQWKTTLREKAISVIKRTFCRGSSYTFFDSVPGICCHLPGRALGRDIWPTSAKSSVENVYPKTLRGPRSMRSSERIPNELTYLILKDCKRKMKQRKNEKYIHGKSLVVSESVSLKLLAGLSFHPQWTHCSNLLLHFVTLFFLFFYRLLQNIEYSSLCYTVSHCWLSILYIVVCIFKTQTANLSFPNTFSFGNCFLCWWVYFCCLHKLICIIF